MDEMINLEVIHHAPQFRERFQTAQPFKHICIDHFFNREFAEKLLADFPSFEAKNAINEFGHVGKKAVISNLGTISPFYEIVYHYIISEQFMQHMSAMTGIPNLRPDPSLFGGGTHENLHGQGLDPHVDFNYSQDCSAHRRLNLLLYLNKNWDEAWGGAIELHSNPRQPESNEIQTFNCIFNRAVIFETNEKSWHGFKRIQLPESERHQSRKALSIYLYTHERPIEEIAPPHGTFYIPRPLTFDLKPETPLTAEQIKEITNALHSRDNWIAQYQALELRLSEQLMSQGNYIKSILAAYKAPITGNAVPIKETQGIYHDGWIAPQASFYASQRETSDKITLKGYLPPDSEAQILVKINGQASSPTLVQSGSFTLFFDTPPSHHELHFEIITERRDKKAQEPSDDKRALGFILSEVHFGL